MAIIAAVSALVGTLVGGIITYETNKSLQDKQIQQEERRQRTAAEAVVRLLISEYHADADRLQQMVALEEYDPASFREHTFVSHVGQEERKLLAGNLPERDWSDVAEAAEAIEAVESELEAHHGKGAIGSDEVKELEEANSRCEAAYKALVPFAEGKFA
ncbi:MAG TPA: hypothetical protein VMG80_05070 [Solirubrobacteraceae bacterium]|nr:hypothetical protein [Solirubrobacteraceae bacterium]